MGQTIISAIGVYISTSIDYLIILFILFAQLSQNKQKWHIYAGQYLGTGLLVGASLVAAYIVNFVPEEWMVGLLGLIPIYLGIRFAISPKADAVFVVSKIMTDKTKRRQSSRNRWFLWSPKL